MPCIYKLYTYIITEQLSAAPMILLQFEISAALLQQKRSEFTLRAPIFLSVNHQTALLKCDPIPQVCQHRSYSSDIQMKSPSIAECVVCNVLLSSLLPGDERRFPTTSFQQLLKIMRCVSETLSLKIKVISFRAAQYFRSVS